MIYNTDKHIYWLILQCFLIYFEIKMENSRTKIQLLNQNNLEKMLSFFLLKLNEYFFFENHEEVNERVEQERKL